MPQTSGAQARKEMETRSFSRPEEVRSFEKGRMEVITMAA